ncbi:heparinase II/III family protein, partial [Dolichospermum sp. ST_con]|nr:heparinase II/III family protein [Dolichospermum sp. ST_con]
MPDIEIKIFIQKIKQKPFLWFLIIPFIYKLSIDLFQKKILKKPKVKFNIPVIAPLADLEFVPLEFINSYSSSLDKVFLHFEHQTEIDKKDEQLEHYLQRFNEVIFSEIDQLTITFNKIQNWIETNPIQKGVAWHSYNVSERIVNWSIFLSRFHSNLTHSQKQIILGSLYQHGAFLYQNFEHHLGHHNHLINNSRGLLYACAIFKNHDFINPWRKKSFEVIETEIKHQILDDGVHAEQSSVYHLLLTRTFWELKQLFKILNHPFNYNDCLKNMVTHFKWMIKTNNTVPFLGHITPAIHWKELVGLGTVMIKNSSIEKSVYAQLFNPDYIIEEENTNTIKIFSKAGIGILKTNNTEIYVSNDPRCQILSHGDQNQLGVDISWFNTHIIRDTGLDSYNLNDNRKWFESWQGQSGFTINDINPIVSNWRRKQLPASHYKATATFETNNVNTIKATHH